MSRNFISIIIIFIVYFNSLGISAQTIVFYDGDKKPIPNLKALILNDNGNLILISYTNAKGELEQVPNKDQSIKITITHPNYKTQSIKILNFGNKPLYRFIIQKELERLNEILITAKKAIRKSGDTTYIDLKQFSSKTDRSLRDAIKRIPGMKIDKNGEIRYKERTITDLLVNGNKLFDSEYKEATDIINPEQIVELAIINNYQDQTGFQQTNLNETALNLNFDKDFIITGSINTELGVPKITAAAINTITSTKILSLYNNFNTNNLGKVSYNGKSSFFTSNDNRVLDKVYQTNYPNYSNFVFNEIFGSFNNTKNVNLNLNVPISSKKEKRDFLLFKFYNTWENFENENQKNSLIFDGINNINRNENLSQNLQFQGNNFYVEYKKKWNTYFLFSNLYINKSTINENNSNTINQVENQFNRSFNNELFSTNLTIENKNSDNRLTTLKLDIFNNRNLDNNTSNGLINFKQIGLYKGSGIFANLKIDLINNESILMQGIVDYRWNKYSLEFENNYISQESNTVVENVNDTKTSIQFIYKQLEKFVLKSTISTYHFNLTNEYNRFENTNITYPSVELIYKNNINKHELSYQNNLSRNSNKLRNDFLIFYNDTSARVQNAYNLPVNTHNINYSYSKSNGINRWETSVQYTLSKDILLESFEITNDLSFSNIQNSKKESQTLNITNIYDFLFLKKWSAIVQSNLFYGSSFQIFENLIKPTNFSGILLDARISKRLGKRFFFNSGYQFQYNLFQLRGNSPNSQSNNSFEIELDYNYNSYQGNIEIISRNYGSDKYNLFINFINSYEIKNWKSNIKLRVVNLFDVDELISQSSSSNLQYNFSQFIPGRRVSFSYTFHF